MPIILSPSMNLPVPSVGTEPGPQYAQDVNNCLTIIDSHDHTAGHGVPITPGGLNINSDLTFNNQNATNLRSVRLQPQSSTLALGSDLGCIYEAGVDLYYNDGSGNVIRITQGGGVSGTPGSISGLAPPASASYVGATQTFVWQSAVNTSANMDAGSYILRNSTTSSKGLTLSPPNAMAADYTITLPALAAANYAVSMDSSGNMTAAPLTFSQLAAAVAQALNPAGTVINYAGAAAPTGYLLCDGSAVSRTTYSGLYAAIGNACGSGDGSTTFNVPDYRGTFLRMVTGASANDPDAASRTAMNTGGNTGNNVGSVQVDGFASHFHQQNTTGTIVPPGVFATQGGTQRGPSTPDAYSTFPVGGNETRPKNAYVNFCIKT